MGDAVFVAVAVAVFVVVGVWVAVCAGVAVSVDVAFAVGVAVMAVVAVVVGVGVTVKIVCAMLAFSRSGAGREKLLSAIKSWCMPRKNKPSRLNTIVKKIGFCFISGCVQL